MKLALQIISATLIWFDCIIFMEQRRDSQRVGLGDGEEHGTSPVQV